MADSWSLQTQANPQASFHSHFHGYENSWSLMLDELGQTWETPYLHSSFVLQWRNLVVAAT